MAGGGTDVLESDVERTDVFDAHVDEPHVEERQVDEPQVNEAQADDVWDDDVRDDETRVPAIDHGVTEAARPAERAETLPEPREEKKFPRDEGGIDPPATSGATYPTTTEPAPRGKASTSQPWTSRLTMLFVAVVALAGLVALAVAIARELSAADGSDDVGDLAYSYTCDKVSGSDPGVYGVGHCRASGGMQASGVIPVGQAYVLTPRKANALGYTQSFSCSGGKADSPSMVVPKRCAAIGNPVLASR